MVTHILLAIALNAAPPHPLHSTITELAEMRPNTVRATIRVFADDFGTAVTKSQRGRAPAPGPAWDAAAIAYIATTFSISGRDGKALALRSCGVRRQAELYWVCVEATAPSLSSVVVGNQVLCDVWEDQVNVVQATINGGRRSLLFTRGDRAKNL